MPLKTRETLLAPVLKAGRWSATDNKPLQGQQLAKQTQELFRFCEALQ